SFDALPIPLYNFTPGAFTLGKVSCSLLLNVVNIGMSASPPLAGSEDAAHQSAIDADRGAIDGGSALATDECDGVADLLRIDQPAKQRGGAVLGDEALFG